MILFALLSAMACGAWGAATLESVRSEGESKLPLADLASKDFHPATRIGSVANPGQAPRLVFQSIVDANSRGSGSVGPAPQEGPFGPPGLTYSANALCRGQGGTYSVCLGLDVIQAVGHNHWEGRPGVKIIGERCMDNVPVNVQARWDFEAPEFAAKLQATWVYRGECAGEPSAQAGFGVADFIELTPGIGYEIRKGAPMHRFNNFGSAVTISLFKNIAAEYRKVFPTAGNLVVLGVSLPWGGLYDVDSSWAPPYSDHRFGFELDLDADSVPVPNRPRLGEIAGKMQVGVEDLGSRLLLTFPPFSPSN